MLIFSIKCFQFLPIERTFSIKTLPLTVCLDVGVDVVEDAAFFNWIF
jgi:hypothetical protein